MLVLGGFLYSGFHGELLDDHRLSHARKAPHLKGLACWRAAREISIYVTAITSLGPYPRIVCRYRIWEITMRLIRFAIGMSLVAISVLGSARAQSPAELSQVSGQEALTNRFESPVSETDRLSDRQQLNAYFLARSQNRLR